MSENVRFDAYTLVCSECMTSGAFTVALSPSCLHLSCNHCSTSFDLSIVDMNKDFYSTADDAGLLLVDAVSN